jgi:hypothetical protein
MNDAFIKVQEGYRVSGQLKGGDLLGHPCHFSSSEARDEKELSQILTSRMTSLNWVRTSKLTRSSARSETTFPWITKQVGYTKAR